MSWLDNANGLRFGDFGTVLSSGQFPDSSGATKPECSLELWVQPKSLKNSGTLLSFYAPDDPVQLRVQQYHSLLILEQKVKGPRNQSRIVGIQNAFRRTGPVFLTITSGGTKSAMYVDGDLVRAFPGYQFGPDCHGELILGSAPSFVNTWGGQLRGLAIYRRELTSSEVLEHFQTWVNQGRPELSGNEGAVGVYLFDERAGNIVHSVIRPGFDLHIPDRFYLWHERFLEPFWLEFKPDEEYAKDLAINIFGFMPLGFFFCLYFTHVKQLQHSRVLTIALGFAVSLTIEVLQSYLPTRDSGTTDLITNTLGTILGVKLYGWMAGRNLLARIYGE